MVTTSSQAAVGLVYFTGSEDDGEVLLEWETAYEDGTAGFRIRRSDNPNTDLSVVYDGETVTFIPSLFDESGFGQVYQVTDTSVQAGQSYVYTLYEVTTGSETNELEQTDQIAVSQSSNNNLATNTPTSNNTQPTSTPTRTPTATPQPTSQATTAASGNATAVPTATQAATATTAGQTTASTATPTRQPTATTAVNNTNNGDDEGQEAPVEENEPAVVAQASAQEGGEEGYPAPVVEEAPAEAEAQAEATAYPETTNGEPTPYVEPAAGGEDNQQTQAIGVGSQATQAGETADNTAVEEGNDSNTLLLWVGFIGAMLIFGGGVVGSLLIFTRRREQ
ncbi:MAG: hypothetical protein KDE51_20585 [Anaerolineales bacterium]|nr:hypothetical protein [Anaerolineales bacterium]